MTRGTTPLHTFTLQKDVKEYSNFIITYRQNGGTVLEKTPEQCFVDGKDIQVRLTQEETLLFDSGQKAFVQLRVFGNDIAEASAIFSFPVNSIMNETILSDGEIPDYATSQDILEGKVAYAGGIKLTGEIEVQVAKNYSINEKETIINIPAGYFAEENNIQVDKEEQNKIIPENIIDTVDILGVQGTAHPCEKFDDTNKTAVVKFSDNTILQVSQKESGIGGNGLNARNLVTGEDTGEVIAAQAGQIAEQGEQIDALTAELEEAKAALANAPRPLNLSIAMAANSLADSNIIVPYCSQSSINHGPLTGNSSLLTTYVLPTGSAFQTITINAVSGKLTGIVANFNDPEKIISEILNTGSAFQIFINNSKLRDYITAHSGLSVYRVTVTFTRA